MVNESNYSEEAKYIVKPGLKILLLGIVFTIVAVLLFKPVFGIEIDKTEFEYTIFYIFSWLISAAFAMFYYLLYMSVRIYVYKDCVIIRDIWFRKRKYYYDDFYLVNMHIDREFGNSQHLVVDLNNNKLVIISEYFTNYNTFCKMMNKLNRIRDTSSWYYESK